MTLLYTNITNMAIRIYCLIFLLLVFVLGLIWHQPAGAFEKPVAKVNGTVLTEVDLEEALNEIMPAGVFHGGFSSEKRAKYRPEAVKKMIEKELFCQEGLKMGLNVEEEVKEEREMTIKRLGGKKKFKAALKRAGLTDKQYRSRLRKKLLVKELITVEIMDEAHASDEEVKAHYERNRKKFMRPEARRITHILIKVEPNATAEERRLKKERAREVIDRIKRDENMAAVARAYSDGPYRVKDGDLGLVHKGQLDADLEKEVYKLLPGRLSGIIETIYGFHIVRVEEVRPPEQLSLEDASRRIKKELTEKKEKQLREALITRLRAAARIEVY